METPSINPPERPDATHDCFGFDCGEQALDAWLKRRALPNRSSGASRIVVATSLGRVAGFHALSAGAVAHPEAIRAMAGNMPNLIMILARLGVDRAHAGKGLGASLLGDAILRTVHVSDSAGVAALLVHAKSKQAADFHLRSDSEQRPRRT